MSSVNTVIREGVTNAGSQLQLNCGSCHNSSI